MPPSQHSVCIYCGSRSGRNAAIAREARALGAALGRAGYALVYGAGDQGIMGEAARAARSAGARITGFIPRHLYDLEVANRDLHAVIVTETMHERKKLMLVNSDAVIALPGGPGTLDELIEVLTWRHLGLHAKPAFLLNTGSYWAPLLALLDHMVAEEFVGPQFRDYFTVADTVDALMAALGEALR
ncbi:MAG: TIGR00730 family Rossman fold protein [Paracoccaceae bacterium]